MDRRKFLQLSGGVAAGAAAIQAKDWPQWRGPARDGISTDTGLLKKWPSGGPPKLWETGGLGEGYSAFSIVGDRLFTQGQRGGRQFVMAFDVTNGKKVWDVELGSSFNERRGNGPRGTPTTDGTKLYALSADGTLGCLDMAGKVLWSANIVEKYGGSVPHWGISESPLIDGNRLIVTPGGRGAAIVALDKADGKLIWKSLEDEAGYSSAIVANVSGTKQIITLTGEAGVGLNANDGKGIWRYTKVSNRTANIATPIFHNNHVFLSTDYGTGCALLKLAPTSATEVYFSREMRNHYSSSVLVNGYLYGFSSSILTAMKFDSGEVAWRDRSVGKGSVSFAEGNLYVLGENGAMALVEATPSGYKEISQFQIQKGGYPTWTPPVIANGRLFLRDQDHLYCFSIKA